MANEPTKYLRWLEGLQKELSEGYVFSPLSERFACIKLVADIVEIEGRFQYLLEVLTTKLDMKLDADVDYEEWSKPTKWPDHDTHNLKDAPEKNAHHTMNQGKLMTQEYANLLSGFFAMVSDNDGIPVDYFPIASQFRESLSNIGSGAVTTNIPFTNALSGALLKLRTTLLKVHQAINGEHEDSKYIALFESLKNGLTASALKSCAVNDFKNWKNHEVVGELTLDKLIEQRTIYIAELMKSSFLQYMQKRCGSKEKALYEQEIDFTLLEGELPIGVHVANYYACFHQIFSLNGQLFEMISSQYVGKYIFDHRKNLKQEDIDAFFRFTYLLDMVQAEITKFVNHDGLVFPLDFDFSNTIFHENLDARKILIALHKMRKEGLLDTKPLFYVPFKYFDENGWVGKNPRTKYDELMNKIFTDLTLNKNDYNGVDSYFKNTAIAEWKKNARQPQISADSFIEAANYMKLHFNVNNFLLPNKHGI